jgi:hypothetical protein
MTAPPCPAGGPSPARGAAGVRRVARRGRAGPCAGRGVRRASAVNRMTLGWGVDFRIRAAARRAALAGGPLRLASAERGRAHLARHRPAPDPRGAAASTASSRRRSTRPGCAATT